MRRATVLAPVEARAPAVAHFAGAQDRPVITGARGGFRGAEDQPAHDPLQTADRDGEDDKRGDEAAETQPDAAAFGHAKKDRAQDADFGRAGEGAENRGFRCRSRVASSFEGNHAKGAKA